jgi:hypothetical protein
LLSLVEPFFDGADRLDREILAAHLVMISTFRVRPLEKLHLSISAESSVHAFLLLAWLSMRAVKNFCYKSCVFPMSVGMASSEATSMVYRFIIQLDLKIKIFHQ